MIQLLRFPPTDQSIATSDRRRWRTSGTQVVEDLSGVLLRLLGDIGIGEGSLIDHLVSTLEHVAYPEHKPCGQWRRWLREPGGSRADLRPALTRDDRLRAPSPPQRRWGC